MVFSQDVFLSKSIEADVDVVIVGAGWAGMAAADHLHKAGISFVVLEAQNYTGGRTHAFEFGAESVGKFVFEQGSNWIQGAKKPMLKNGISVKRNPLAVLAEKEGLETVYIPGATDGNMSNYFKVYDEFGEDGDRNGALRKKANQALECLSTKGDDQGNKVTVRQLLNKCGWKPQTNVEWALDWAFTADESGTRAEDGAANAFLPDPSYDWWGPDDWLVTDQHPRGFARLIDAMVRDSVPDGDARIKLNTHVSNINWGSNGVLVKAKDGRIFSGKHAISTVSYGVLQKHHKHLFTPSLPSSQVSDLMNNGLFMAPLTHVLVQFPTVWWDDSLPAWLATNTGGEASAGNFTAWHNFNHQSKLPGSQTLLSFLGDPQAAEYGELNEDELKAVLLDRIRAQHPGKEIPEPSAAWLKNWVNDPLFYGAYVNFAPGVSWKETWKKPLKANKKKIVQFAGEAACDCMDGYTHGAMYSGIQAAANYAFQIGKGPDPSMDDNLSLCDKC
jgi:polyamine oxidase